MFGVVFLSCFMCRVKKVGHLISLCFVYDCMMKNSKKAVRKSGVCLFMGV